MSLNFYVLDKDPKEAARFYTDRHVSRAIMEVTQFLTVAHVYLDGQATARANGIELKFPRSQKREQLQDFGGHPISRWVRHTSGNYVWTAEFLTALAMEFKLRAGRPHVFEDSGTVSLLRKKPLNIVIGDITEVPQDVPTRYRRANTVDAYRAFYFGEKKHLALWSLPSKKPDWWVALEGRA